MMAGGLPAPEVSGKEIYSMDNLAQDNDMKMTQEQETEKPGKKKRFVRRKKRKKQKRFSITNLILVLILLAGVGILAYPTFSDWWNSFHQSRAIAGYVEKVAELGEVDIDNMWSEAEQYNKELASWSNRFMPSKEDQKIYDKILDVTGTGIMGYIDIQKINVSLPIYHGTDEAILQIAIGHIEGSSFPIGGVGTHAVLPGVRRERHVCSFPIGGVGTHAVLSGHRGLPSAKLFSDIDQLENGDRFVIQVLDRTMTYEVDQIRIVLPSELQDLEIDPKQDYVTLVTCTPYGVNTHRLLVRGHRVANDMDDIRVVADAMQFEPVIVAPLVAAPILLILLIMMLTSTGERMRKRDSEALIHRMARQRTLEQRAQRRSAKQSAFEEHESRGGRDHKGYDASGSSGREGPEDDPH